MKVVFDHQAFSMQKFGGISRYFSILCEKMYHNKLTDFDVILKFSNNQYLESNALIDLIKYRHFAPNLEFKGKKVLMELLNQKFFVKKIKKVNFDVFHPTYYNPYFIKSIQKKPYVLTVHDMTHELFPQYFSRFDKSAYHKKLLLKNASRIIAVSENTKKDLINIYNVQENSIDVIYHGYNLLPHSEDLQINLPKQYLLFVGQRGRYKNFEFMLKSLIAILKKYDLFLIVAGGDVFNKKEIQFFEAEKIRNKVIHIKVNDHTLSFLYQNAYAFIFPSLYEGFGMPVLEAFSKGCPVLCSNCSSLPEVAGDAAIYFNPKESDSIIDAVQKIIDNSDEREKLINKGFKRLQEFSWDKTLLETIKVYEKALK